MGLEDEGALLRPDLLPAGDTLPRFEIKKYLEGIAAILHRRYGIEPSSVTVVDDQTLVAVDARGVFHLSFDNDRKVHFVFYPNIFKPDRYSTDAEQVMKYFLALTSERNRHQEDQLEEVLLGWSLEEQGLVIAEEIPEAFGSGQVTIYFLKDEKGTIFVLRTAKNGYPQYDLVQETVASIAWAKYVGIENLCVPYAVDAYSQLMPYLGSGATNFVSRRYTPDPKIPEDFKGNLFGYFPAVPEKIGGYIIDLVRGNGIDKSRSLEYEFSALITSA